MFSMHSYVLHVNTEANTSLVPLKVSALIMSRAENASAFLGGA